MPARSYKILIADNCIKTHSQFLQAFDELNIVADVTTLHDGTALTHYLSLHTNPLPDILFLELNIQNPSGLSCLQNIRSCEKYDQLSIVIFSTSTSQIDIEETFLNGANVYIIKPDNFKSLKQILRKSVLSAHLYQDPPFNISTYLLTA